MALVRPLPCRQRLGEVRSDKGQVTLRVVALVRPLPCRQRSGEVRSDKGQVTLRVVALVRPLPCRQRLGEVRSDEGQAALRVVAVPFSPGSTSCRETSHQHTVLAGVVVQVATRQACKSARSVASGTCRNRPVISPCRDKKVLFLTSVATKIMQVRSQTHSWPLPVRNFYPRRSHQGRLCTWQEVTTYYEL